MKALFHQTARLIPQLTRHGTRSQRLFASPDLHRLVTSNSTRRTQQTRPKHLLASPVAQHPKEGTCRNQQTRSKHVLASPDISGFADHLKECRNIVVLAGAGLSTSAGLTDFRTPGTGLYDKLKQHGLEYPEDVFDINLFRKDPRAFYAIGRDLMPRPELYQPTLAHYFIRLLSDHGRLLRMFTQNVDGLEYLAGIPDARVVTAHGDFRGGHCTGSDTTRPCGHTLGAEEVRRITLLDNILDCICPRCQTGYVKPSIVFFGENLPKEFWFRAETDLKNADALVVMGTSLQVFPFAGLVDEVPKFCPRLWINKTADWPFEGVSRGERDWFGRDAIFQGSCDDGAKLLAGACGIGKGELIALAEKERGLVKQWGEELASNAGKPIPKGEHGFWDGLPWLKDQEHFGLPKPRL
jgi:NAD-dependent deacetylase sirtuin 2